MASSYSKFAIFACDPHTLSPYSAPGRTTLAEPELIVAASTQGPSGADCGGGLWPRALQHGRGIVLSARDEKQLLQWRMIKSQHAGSKAEQHHMTCNVS